MNKRNKNQKAMLLLLLLCISLLLAGFSSSVREPGTLMNCGILHEPEFGGVYIKITIENFNAMGFAYGDSVDVSFSNGYELKDQPYFNGYYTENGQTLLVAYPGYDYIKAGVNNGDDLWELAELTGDDTATITLNERGKYLDIQNARNIYYYDKREMYASDDVFANFRCVAVTGIAPNTLYRSASPCDNQHNRATYVDELMNAAGVRCILDLADNAEKIEGYIADDQFNCSGFLPLYEEGDVIPLALNTNFTSDGFMQKLAAGLISLSEREGPYLVHCTEGKDRTGFVCLLLEALCGAGYEEIVEDYMITYDNYYGITYNTDPDRYHVIVEHVLDPMVRILTEDKSIALGEADLASGARAYLLAAGMDNAQIDKLRDSLSTV